MLVAAIDQPVVTPVSKSSLEITVQPPPAVVMSHVTENGAVPPAPSMSMVYVPLGAVADKSFSETLASDPNVAATLANAQAGVPMPSTPAMGKFWAAMGPALTNITTGAQEPATALDDAAKRILAE